MPRRGYRKGISDDKTPLGKRIHTRLPDSIHKALMEDAASRSTDACKLLRRLTTAHYTGRRPELPHARGINAGAVRELGRLGNNLNQIAHQAHLMRLHLLEADARSCVAAVLSAVDRLG